MNLMELFGRRPEPVQQQSVQQQVIAPDGTAQQVPPVVTSADGNTTIPNGNTGVSDGSLKAIPKAGEGEASPLENYKDLWQAPDPTKTPAKPSLAPNFNIDQKVIRENAAKINFASVIPAAILDKALSGDKASFLSALNTVAQAGFARAAEMSAGLTHAALSKQAEVFETTYAPEMFRRHNISQEIRADNPIFSDPAVAPILTMLETQLATKYTTETPQRISEMAKEIVEGMSETVLRGQGKIITDAPDPKAVAKGKRGETDWTNYFSR